MPNRIRLSRLLSTTPPPPTPPSPAIRRKADVDSEPLHEETLKTLLRQREVYTMPHPIWPLEFVDGVQITHKQPNGNTEKFAYLIIRAIRFNFDWMSGYSWRILNENIWLSRFLFLETIAGIPGVIAGCLRHLRSLRRLERDNGWIHTLYEEAENERMHLLTFLQLKQPSFFMKVMVFLSQGVFFNFFWIAYILHPKFCHSLVGFLEEEAVITYTHCLSEIDKGHLPKWSNLPAPEIAKKYWKLPEGANFRDVIAVIRADEAHHRDVNHTFSTMKPTDSNPFPPGY